VLCRIHARGERRDSLLVSGSLRNALGIYVAVMGVFVNVLVWVLRILELLDV